MYVCFLFECVLVESSAWMISKSLDFISPMNRKISICNASHFMAHDHHSPPRDS